MPKYAIYRNSGIVYYLLMLSALFFCRANLAYALDWKKMHEAADNRKLEVAFKDAQANPDSAEALYVLGLVYLNMHQDDNAQKVFSKVIELEPQTIEARWGLAEVLRRQHLLDESQELLREVIKTKPGFCAAYISLAYIEYSRREFNEAVRLAVKVLAQGLQKADVSNYVRAHLITAGAKGLIAHYGGPVSKLINGTVVFSHLKKAQGLQPDSAAVLFGLGSFYLLAPPLAGGSIEKAGDYLKKALKADPLFADGYVRLAQFYKIKGDRQNYNAHLNKALELDPRNDLALDIKSGECHFICKGPN